MVGLHKMPVQTYFLNGFILFIVDGYLNMVIYFFRKKLIVIEERKIMKQ
jgi:hypothetical protein